MKPSPHNDWTGLEPDPAAASDLSAAVVIPVYNRPDLLARTLAGLERSTRPVPVIVADDGSEADIAAVVDASPLDVTLVSQVHDGNGAARARNLGAEAAGDVDLVVFVDADCVPHPDLVATHLAWQAAGPDVISIGRRIHVRIADVAPADISAGHLDLTERQAESFSGRPDFRRVLERRTGGLTTGDEAFRTFVSSNVAVPRDLFRRVGGFADRFPHWGSEDTELGWRLWQEGAWFVPASEAIVFHQLDEDEEGGHAGRSRSRALNDGSLTTLVPHGFYRKPRRDVIYEVPKVSIVVHHPPPALDDLWTDISGQTAPDLELILVGCDASHQPMAGLLEGDPRVRLVDTMTQALGAARGELVVTANGSLALDHRFLARVVKHFHDRPTTSSLTVGYTLPSDPPQAFLTPEDAAWIDQRWDASDLPLVTVARRRDWAKVGGVVEGWEAIRRMDRADHLAQGLAWIPGTDPVGRPDGFVANKPTRAEMLADLKSEPRRAVRTGAKILRSRYQGTPYSIPTAPAAAEPTGTTDGPVHARYVGWVGYDNLGDEAMLEATRRLLPWADVEVSGTPRELLLLGGGTLINRSTYLNWLVERDSPRIERAAIGTGVANPGYWGLTEPAEAWVRWLSSCVYLGVRGPHSEATLRSWGYDGPLEVCGDSALLLERPAGVEPVDGRVVVSPAWTNGELWGGSDQVVMDVFAAAVRRWVGDGRDVAFLSCNPADDRPIFEIMRAAGHPGLTYLAGYRDLDAALALLASAGLVVGERLHAAVLAAAVGAPFVSLEYRPKLADFAASVGAEAALVRTDALTVDSIESAAIAATSLADEVARHVETYRSRLAAAAETIHRGVRA